MGSSSQGHRQRRYGCGFRRTAREITQGLASNPTRPFTQHQKRRRLLAPGTGADSPLRPQKSRGGSLCPRLFPNTPGGTDAHCVGWGQRPHIHKIYAVTTPALSRTACSNTLVPASAHSGVIASASLWLRPPAQGHMIIMVGATRLIQQAS